MTALAAGVLFPFAVAVAGLLLQPLRRRLLPFGLLPSLILAVAGQGCFPGQMFRLEGPLGVAILPDGTARLMFILSSLVGLGIWLWMRRKRQGSPWFQPLALLMIGACNAVFVSFDLFNVYVGIELVTVLGFLLIRLEGGPRQIWASVKYLLLGNLGMTLFLLALLRVYALTGDLSFTAVASVPLPLVMLLVSGLAVKGGLFVFGFWLPEAHGGASPPVSALLSGVVVLTGIIPVLRLAMIRPDLVPVLQATGALSVLLGILLALRERDVKRLLACSTLSQLGYALLVPAAGAAFVLGHGLCKSWLFLAAGDLPGKQIDRLRIMPVPIVAWTGFVVPCLVLAGLPGTALWSAKTMIVQESGPALSIFVKGTSLLTVFYLFRSVALRPLAIRPSLSWRGVAGPAFFAASLLLSPVLMPSADVSVVSPVLTLVAGILAARYLPLVFSREPLPAWERLDHLMGGFVVTALLLYLTGGMLS